MTDYTVFLMFPALLLLIVAGFPIAFALICIALIFGTFQFGDSVIYQLLSKVDDVASNSVLAAVPLFIFMGAMLERSGIAERLFEAVHLWTRRVPGSLAVAAVIMGAIFAAASGVVGATETVIGLLLVPIMLKHSYDKKLISGSLCASGSLGTVIPPSITVIVLGPVANISVGDLYAGLLIPGLFMALTFIIYIIFTCALNPQSAPRTETERDYIRLAKRLKITLYALMPPLVLIFTVLGTILMGLATPTEAAACGALGTVILSIIYRNFSWRVTWQALRGTASITAMILLIVLGGNMFAGVFFASGGMEAVKSLLTEFGLPAWGTIALILGLGFLTGFVLDTISIILIIIPVAMPIVMMHAINPIWFCVAFLVALQAAYISPPMAPSIFYLRAIAPPEITLKHMYRGVVPFIFAQLVTLALVVLFPDLALWLPKIAGGPNW